MQSSWLYISVSFTLLLWIQALFHVFINISYVVLFCRKSMGLSIQKGRLITTDRLKSFSMRGKLYFNQQDLVIFQRISNTTAVRNFWLLRKGYSAGRESSIFRSALRISSLLPFVMSHESVSDFLSDMRFHVFYVIWLVVLGAISPVSELKFKMPACWWWAYLAV